MIALSVSGCSVFGPLFSPEDESSEEGLRSPIGVPVTIQRDAFGVPHVSASTDEAAFYGVGWAAAEDRLYQMHTKVLAVQGRLAEHFGPGDYVTSDKKARVFGSWRSAQAKADQLDPEVKALLQAFADGVNAHVAAQGGVGGPLFEVNGVAPQRWTVAHCLASWHELADDFSISALGEAKNRADFEADVASMGRAAALEKVHGRVGAGVPEHGVVQLEDVDRSYVEAVQAYAVSLGVDPAVSQFDLYGVDGPQFSHAFALADWRTESGGAMIMADPQLPVLLPSIFWEYQVSSPNFAVRGAATPGTPALMVGQSDAVAWGITAGAGDQSDLFKLTDGARPNTYILDGQELEMQVEDEVIEVLGGPSIDVTYRATVWGPVVTDVIPAPHANPDAEYAMKSLIVSEDDRDTAEGMFGMMRANSLDDFVGSLDDWRSPNVNVVAAASSGSIYYSLIGGIPVRSNESPLGGFMAQDGDTTDSDWLDIIPHEYMPQVTDPASGTVYSGNHRPAGGWYPLPLALPRNGGGHGHRSARLRDQLDNDRIFDADTFLDEVQNDCVDSSRQRFMQLAVHVLDTNPAAFSTEAARVVNVLREWSAHGSMQSDVEEVWMVKDLLVSFRAGETGDALQEQYSTSEFGMVNFLDHMDAAIAADPTFLPDALEVAYLERILMMVHDAQVEFNETLEGSWEEDYAVLDLLYHQERTGMVFAPPLSVQTEVLPCAWKDTIWSQTAQSYSHFVDFGSGRRGSVKAPGAAENRHQESMLAELELWTDGDLKPAPVDRRGVDAIAVSTETLTFVP